MCYVKRVPVNIGRNIGRNISNLLEEQVEWGPREILNSVSILHCPLVVSVASGAEELLLLESHLGQGLL